MEIISSLVKNENIKDILKILRINKKDVTLLRIFVYFKILSRTNIYVYQTFVRNSENIEGTR